MKNTAQVMSPFSLLPADVTCLLSTFIDAGDIDLKPTDSLSGQGIDYECKAGVY